MTSPVHVPEYNTFVKTFLVNQCYNEYCKLAIDSQDLLSRIDDEQLWNSVFRVLHVPLQYYIGLVERTDPFGLLFPLYKLYIVYPSTNSFQDYIDASIHIESVSSSDYLAFSESMQDPTFRNNLFDRYVKSETESAVKNHLIYLMRLYLLSQSAQQKYFSDEEHQDMEISLDARPYFEYLSMNDLTTTDDIDYVDCEKNMVDTTWRHLEMRALKIFHRMLFPVTTP